MAIHTPIIPPCHSEAVPSFCPSPVTVLFGAMMRNLSAYVEAERDLEHSGSWDPACDAWIRDAERARTRTLDSLAQLDATPLERREDQPLKRLSKMAQMLIESDTPEAFRNTFALQGYFPDLFRCANTSPMGRRTNQMVAAFQQHLNALRTLPDFTDAIEADHAETEQDDPGHLMAPAA
ncbi:hypothetical protein [Falsirhodobacter sp. alg1]|uniref:hypothetical protein n=1 Tax=Falsirhodobacter sp. alg1 TaxID=1472418 RepID=UPI0006932C0C|nr:hypothetical protein [Falsirhodobacter sp. alg1]